MFPTADVPSRPRLAITATRSARRHTTVKIQHPLLGPLHKKRLHLSFLVLFVASLFPACGGNGGNGPTAGNPNGGGPDQGNLPEYILNALVYGTPEIRSLHVNDRDIFWTADHTGEGVLRVSKSGGDVTVLAHKTISIILGIQGNSMFLVRGGSRGNNLRLDRMSLDGTGTEQLSEGSGPPLLRFAADETAVYWVSGQEGTHLIKIERVPLDGSAPVVLTSTPYEVTGLAVDSHYIYWQEILNTPNPGDARIIRIPKTGGNSVVLTGDLHEPTGGLTLLNGQIFFADYGRLLKMSVDGGGLTPLVEGPAVLPIEIDIQGADLYWINRPYFEENPSIKTIPITGGPASALVTFPGNIWPDNLLVAPDSFFWTEPGPDDASSARVLKRFSLHSMAIDKIAENEIFYFLQRHENDFYFATGDHRSTDVRILRLPVSGGIPTTLLGGVASDYATIKVDNDFVYINDGGSLKKVPVNGGVTATIFSDPWSSVDDFLVKDGTVYFIAGGFFGDLFEITVDGSTRQLADQLVGCDAGRLLTIDDAYIYYTSSETCRSRFQELRRIPRDGGDTFTLYTTKEGQELLTFDGSDSLYIKEWIWNDQYRLLRYNLSSGTTTELFTGSFFFIGINDHSVYIQSGPDFSELWQVPGTGGNSHVLLEVLYPLWLSNVAFSINSIFVSASYLDETKGTFSDLYVLRMI